MRLDFLGVIHVGRACVCVCVCVCVSLCVYWINIFISPQNKKKRKKIILWKLKLRSSH